MSFTPPVGDATSAKKGLIRLTGDLGGTASLPTVPGLTGKAGISHSHVASDIGVLTLTQAVPGSRLMCPWNSLTSKWTYDSTDLNARPSNRTDIFFVYTGAPAATADPTYAIAGDKREDI